MWVRGKSLHFIADSGSQKNLILVKTMKRLNLKTLEHMQPYSMGWVSQGRDIQVHQWCRLSYSIKPFKDEVIYDVSPLYVCDVLLRQPYMYQHHGVYESRPCSVTIRLGEQKYRIPKVSLAYSTSLISAKKCRRLVARMGTFILLMMKKKGNQYIIPLPSQTLQHYKKYQWIRF